MISKYAAAMSMLGVLLVGVIASGALFGGIVFGFGPLPTLSGSSLSVVQASLRILGAGAYILIAAEGITAIGIFVSTLTDSGPGATVATVILAITSQILDNIPSLHAIHGYLPTHGWLAYTDLFRFPVDWVGMRAGLVVSAAYAAVFLAAALLVFGRKDVTA